jgi:hypothetical protein
VRPHAHTPLDIAAIVGHPQAALSKAQFMALNVVGGLCGLLIVCDLVLGLLNGRLNRAVAANQNQFGQAQQVQATAQNLVVRIAQAGQSDPALRELLAKHDFHLKTNTPAKPSP